jgi:hemoglobin
VSSSPTPALHEGHGDRLAGRLSGLGHVNRDDLGGVGHAHGVQCASGAEPVPAAEAPPGIARNRVPASADGPTMLCMANGAAAETSLYERLGGVYAIAVVVDDFIDRIMVDPRLNANPRVDEAHHRVSAQGFKYYVTEQVCWAAGGPQTYSGRTMLDSHRELLISGAEWDAFMDDFHQTLANFGVPERERGELDAIVESTKDDIVTSAAPAASQ